ncbi:MAG: transposase, partial [candidate division Zixibacteria bacterium]|nr:transposase [candidate division Zixibacteria bacterium]
DKKNYFDTDSKKEIIKKRFKTGAVKFKMKIHAWVILSNYYHLLFQFKEIQNLGEFIGFINGGSSFELNSLENKRGRQIWWNYWDRCIRNEQTFYKRFNYIHHNPVKHGYVEKCEDYEFSSYNYYLKKLGEDYMKSIFAQYSIIDFTDKNDKFWHHRSVKLQLDLGPAKTGHSRRLGVSIEPEPIYLTFLLVGW